MVVLPAVQRVEVADAVHPKDHGLAIDHKPLLAVPQRGLSNPGITLRPVAAVAGEQPDALVFPDDQHPMAVVLYLMDPVRPWRGPPG